jgi:hypothetical protein
MANQPTFDATAGQSSRELDRDPTIMEPGAHQFLGDEACHHDDDPTNIWTEHSNVVQAGMLPQASGPVYGAPTAASPAGTPGETSLEP